ncbi:aspartate/glutamate racemase family protein [Pseudomonas sp. 21TX0197]|uniref:glutamate racemase n=1 Tax=Pseudomonas sp. 21TX0197 TaxID=2972639 RepID=UPI00232BB35E|nr:aspartate/glutamate racemase family protein [Pseudomonas sp. 21TX0197]MDB6443831.1 aspartate/glutamate racemase family protein [Pseudomonas sp. 21TX0197]
MIGVFDFGSGGLTVMRTLEFALPHEHFVYLGYHGNPPYGNNASGDIYDLTLAAVARLFEYGCSLVVIACNTAVATSLRNLKQSWLPAFYPDREVIGVVTPVAEEAADAAVESVAVFATQHTVDSNIFATEINKRNPATAVYQQVCNGLALLIEQDAPTERLRVEIRKHVDALLVSTPQVPQICILGCTHYALVEPLWRAELPGSVRILSQSRACAENLTEYLQSNPRFSSAKPGSNSFLTTGDVETVSERASLFYGARVEFSKI